MLVPSREQARAGCRAVRRRCSSCVDLDEAEPLLVVVDGCAAEVEGLDLAPAEGGRHGGREGKGRCWEAAR